MVALIIQKCLVALARSGFVASDVATYPPVMNNSTLMKYHLTGEFIGTDAIVEYISFSGGHFMSKRISFGPHHHDLSQSTEEECVLWTVGAERLVMKDPYTYGESESNPACYDFILGSVIKFSLTEEGPSGVLFNSWDVFTDNNFMSEGFGLIDTEATADFMCDVIENSCAGEEEDEVRLFPKKKKKENTGRRKKAKEKKGRRNKQKKNKDDVPMGCLDRLLSLDAITDGAWADGDSRICRILHGSLAKINPFHCPHVSFVDDADSNGDIKCKQSTFKTVEDIFTPDELAFFQSATLPYNNSATSIAHSGSCPDISSF